MDSYAKATGNLAERKTSHHELVTDSVAAESNLATCTENQRFEQQIWFAGAATESVRHQANQELAVTETMAALEYEKIKLFRDHARRELSEARAQLAAIEARGHDHSSCQEFQSLESENRAARSQIKHLEAELQHLTGELKEAQGLVTGYKNSFAITDKILNEQHAEIAEQKVEIARLSVQVAELQGVPESPSDNDEVEEQALRQLTDHTGVVEHLTSGHPLVMRIDVWVGGAYGTDTELALVKMNPETPFKAILEDLRRHHPLKALKQKDTGRYIFESDTPAYVSIFPFPRGLYLHADGFQLGFKDGEELDFIQQSNEPMFMLDATMEGVKSWRGKDSRV